MAAKTPSKTYSTLLLLALFSIAISYTLGLNYLESVYKDLSDLQSSLKQQEKRLLNSNHLARIQIKQLSRRERIEPLAQEWCKLTSPQILRHIETSGPK
jgi:hypothetical protein